jgi:hypothetical protein
MGGFFMVESWELGMERCRNTAVASKFGICRTSDFIIIIIIPIHFGPLGPFAMLRPN